MEYSSQLINHNYYKSQRAILTIYTLIFSHNPRKPSNLQKQKKKKNKKKDSLTNDKL